MAATAPGGSAGAAGSERFLSGYAGRLFLVLTLGSITVKMGRYLVPPLLPSAIADLGITAAQAGVALSVMSVFYALLHYPGGRLSDQLSRKTVVVAGLAAVTTGFAAVVGSRSYLGLLVGLAGVGAGRGLFAPSGRALLSDLFVDRRGQAFGLFMSSTDVGGIAAAGLATVLVGVVVWQWAFLPVVALLGVVTVAFHVIDRDSYHVGAVDLGVRETGVRLFSVRRIRRIVVAYVLFVLTVSGVIGFLPTFLRETHGFSPGAANGTFALLFVVGLGSKPLAGTLSDLGIRPVVGAGALVVSMLGIGLLVLADTAALVVAGVVVYALGQKAFGPVMQAYLMDLFPDGSMGGDLGATRTLYLGVGGLGPTYVGVVAGWAGYRVAFAGFVACLLVAAVITLGISSAEWREQRAEGA